MTRRDPHPPASLGWLSDVDPETVRAQRWRLQNRTTLLLSMGGDSLAAWVAMGMPQAVYYHLGSRYTAPEVARYRAMAERFPSAPLAPVSYALEWLARDHEGDGPTAFVPLRNLLLVMATWARGVDDVVLAAATDYGPDKRLAFTLSAQLAGRVALGRPGGRHCPPGRGPLTVRRPFRWYTKARLLAAARDAYGSWDAWLPFVYSCYTGSDPACGTCRACRRMAVALAACNAPFVQDAWALARTDAERARLRFRDVYRVMPNAFSFGTRPALAELAYWPLRTHMAYRAWRNTVRAR